MLFNPVSAGLDDYKAQAAELLKACKANNSDALARIAPHNDPIDDLSLHNARLTVSREHGFDNWQSFERGIDLAPQLRDALDPGDPDRVRTILDEVPQLADCVPYPKHRPDTQPIEIVSAACVWHRPRKHEVAQALIDAGATCDITQAARAGLVSHVRNLLDGNPSLIDFRDKRRRTALYRAGCVYGTFKEGEAVVDLLLERGAKPDIFVASTFAMAQDVENLLAVDNKLALSADPDGMTALHWAVRPRRIDGPHNPTHITKLLIESGADVHAINPTEEGMQPLHHAGEWSAYSEQIDVLLAHGADINTTAENGWTPLDYAIDRSRGAIAEHLKALGAKESGVR